MDELLAPASQLRSVRLCALLQKRSGSFPYGWNGRYVVLSANFVYLYNAESDFKPKKIFCVDGCTVTVSITSTAYISAG